jgi:glycerol kinase
MSDKGNRTAPLVLALDQGTHASRALVFDRRGRLLSSGMREVGLARPQPDWAEQDGEELVASVVAATEQALASLGADAARVRSAGLAIQRSTSLCWDRPTGRPLSPVISWQDRRTHAWLRQFEAQGETIHRKTGLFLTPHYGGSKLRWCLDHLPAVRQALAEGRLCWGPLASFLAFRLLRERPHVVDPQCASRTQLWNVHTRAWDAELLDLFGVPAGVLPRCVPTCHAFGTFAVAGAAIPWTAVNGDATAGLFAFGWPETDAAYVTMGTGAFLLRALEQYPGYAPRQLTGIVLEDGRTTLYMLEGSVNGAGAALTWLGEALQLDDAVHRLPEWLERPGEPPLFLNGVAGLASPFWQADFASRFVGAGEPWQQAVAVVESIAFLLQANLDEMDKLVPRPRRLRVTGGVARLDGLCRRLAALSGLPVLRRDDPEGTARGIAYLAAGRPAEWNAGGEEQVFEARDEPGVRERYRRWRAEMARLTGV